MKDVESTIISQYGNSATISKLIHNMNKYIDPRKDLDAFYDTVWNIETAEGFGLDIWGRVVDLPTGRNILTSPVTILNDTQFRPLILVKALSNISITSSAVFNQLLSNYFAGRGPVFVSDQLNMSMRYNFQFQPEPFEIQILAQPGIFLRPAGVQVSILVINGPVFGFREGGPTYTGFNQAPFVSTEILT
jgi:hypothetical protein